MALLKAGVGAAGGVLADQWKDYFYCEAMDRDVLVMKGEKRTSRRSSNTKASDNIITNGSVVAVADGQCMLIVDQGKIAEVCADPGEFVYDASTEPSIFSGDLSTSIKESFKTVGKRFTFGGDTAHDQRVYFVNTKEIMGNKFGTPEPIPFRVVDQRSNIDQDFDVRCFGQYSYRIVDPVMFYTNVCSNVSTVYEREEIDGQLKSEFLTALQPSFARISDMGVRISALPGHTKELAKIMREELSEDWTQIRGIEVERVGISSVSLTEEDREMLKSLQRATTLSNPAQAAGYMAGATGEAMNAAARNTTAGPAMAFMGMGMAQNAGGGYASLFQQANQQQQMQAQQQYQQQPQQYQQQPNQQYSGGVGASSWSCVCGATNTGKFCATCGKPMPQQTQQGQWGCGCGAMNTGKFCTNCGQPMPSQNIIHCDKCGWTPPANTQAPKFCPNCGDVIDQRDMS